MRKFFGILGVLAVFGYGFTEILGQEAWIKASKTPSGISRASQEYFDKALLSTSPKDQIEWYSKALLKEVRFLEAFVNRGIAHGKNAEFAKAILDFETAMAIDTKDPLPYVNRAYAWLLQQNYDQAIADYDRAIALDEKNAVIHNSRAYALYLKADFEKALEDYDRAIVLNPEPYFYYNRGTLKKRMGDEAGAEIDFELARISHQTS
jgi:tetratricopeptide (TPR) repeat protein